MPPSDDSDIPEAMRRELMECATSNGRISYYYLCDVWRRGRSGQVLAALHAVLANPHGCPMCDSGTLRNPAKSHWDNCPYLLARQALGEAQSARSTPMTEQPANPPSPAAGDSPQALREVERVIAELRYEVGQHESHHCKGECAVAETMRAALSLLERASPSWDRAAVSATVSPLYADPEDDKSPIESHDLYVEGRGVSLLVNLESGKTAFTWSLGVDRQHQAGGTVGDRAAVSLSRTAEEKRCVAVQPGTGVRCGMYADHDGQHTVLIPTAAPWAKTSAEGSSSPSQGEEKT